jgi:16S rRNA (cytidine1402-2'-O)-methyltransferase
MTNPGSLYLIPCPLSEHEPLQSLPPSIAARVAKLSVFLVENEKSARHFIKSLNPNCDLPSLTLIPLNEHSDTEKITVSCAPLREGQDMGVISEAGCPGVADPGTEAVRYAHSIGARVIPLVGPNSMLLALMASGCNGQRWRFVGYPPRKEPERSTFLKSLFLTAMNTGESQIVMEAPYRSSKLLQDLLRAGSKDSVLCIAANLSDRFESIQTKRISAWRESSPDLHRSPAVFIIGDGKSTL